jgi:dethiobiotin synthetase
MRGYIVAGIGTEVGKTIVSAIFVQHLGADYWKPVQAGELENSDTRIVRDLAPGGACFHPEAYRLEQAMSPHAAASLEGLTLRREKMALPQSGNTLIVEPAGGLMVPLAPGLLNIDLIQEWNLPVVLVSSYYLGSINHTLLSVEALVTRQISILGLVFNGEPVASTRQAILENSGLPLLLEIGRAGHVDADWVNEQAGKLCL